MMRIGICGFGVAGGALATFLARAGHEVTLLERAAQVGPVGAGFLLQPAGQRVLEHLGLLPEIVAASSRIERLEAFTHDGRQLTDLHYSGAAPGACAYGVRRSLLFSVLHSAALAAGVTVVLAAEAAEADESESGIILRDVSGRAHGPFDLLAGADGSRSWLRKWLNPGAHPREYVHGALWGTGRSEQPVDSLYQITRGARQLLGLLPIGEGAYGFFWGLRRDELEPLEARGFAAFRDEVLTLSPRAAEILEDLGGFDRLTFASYGHALPRRLHSARTVLVGDAAHSMSPHLGQGANLALLDADCLARQVSELPLAEALPAYAAERRSHSRYLAHLSRGLSPFFQSDRAVLGWGRDIALPLMGSIPWLRRQMELTVAGMKHGPLHRLW